MIRITGLYAVLLFTLALGARAQDSLSLASPDGKLVFRMEMAPGGRLDYRIDFDGKEVIERSRLGVQGLDTGLTLRRVAASSRDTVWRPVYGERDRIRDAYNGKWFIFDRGQVEVRAYNAGIAFRYVFREQSS